MAAAVKNVDGGKLKENIDKSRLLIVGAGGIGCELIKNLVLAGFVNLEVIDLDTIDVSNLNRQFLFRKEHVGMSKAKVARDSALYFNPDTKILAHHDSIMSPQYDVNYFKSFTMVLNALDNRAARNHVNRMCLAANVPLVESGTAGYLGQVQVILKGRSECYECQPKPTQKQFPGCTIRNTPSEPIHCIVWAKHLFNQLFGEADDDQDVSPDTADPELTADAGQTSLQTQKKEESAAERVSTRQWAIDEEYDAEKLFNKLFRDDIKYLLSMETLWSKRRAPVPLDWSHLPPDTPQPDHHNDKIKDQRLWSVKECAEVFEQSIHSLKTEFFKQGDGGILVWDKDDAASMDFVCAVANIRSHIFGIQCKTRFDVKSMAGNIIPAIATTNAIIAGLIVVEAVKILRQRTDTCKMIYLSRKPNPRNKLIIPCNLLEPNPKCYVCQPKPEVTLHINTQTFIVKQLEEKILKSELGMVAPDVEIDDGKGTIVISSEEGETEELSVKTLAEVDIKNGSRLKCDDFLQEYNLVINIAHVDKLENEKEFELVRGDANLAPRPCEEKTESPEPVSERTERTDGASSAAATAGGDAGDDDDVCMIVEEADDDVITAPNDVTKPSTSSTAKRKASQELPETSSPKKQKTSHEDEDVICIN